MDTLGQPHLGAPVQLVDAGGGVGGLDLGQEAVGLAANTLAEVANIVVYNKALTDKRKDKKRRKKAKKKADKLAEAVARLIAATSEPTPADQSAASDRETPPRAPP